jgi:uncharacterized protein
VQQKVEVRVVEVDVNRKRIALSMKENKGAVNKPVQKEQKESLETDLQQKLSQLKSLFK